MLGREVQVNDYVVSYNYVYRVIGIVRDRVRMELVKPSKTSRPALKNSFEICKVDSEAVKIWEEDE